MQTQYDNYTAEQFLDDPFFIRWIKARSKQDEAFWQEWITSNPGNLEEYMAAEIRLAAILSAEPIGGENLKEEVWEDIQASIITREKVRPLFTRWMAAASVLVVLIAGFSYFYFNGFMQRDIPEAVAKNTHVKHDVAPGGNKAILTLADGSTIILDSAQNGMLSQQGNSKVIKLQSGKLAYEQSAIGNQQLAMQYNTIATPRGGQYQLELADGSHVWLNAASSITFPTSFTGNIREVKITGEVYFEVAHNAAMPFHVSVNKVEVEVLGTHFNVNAYGDDGMINTTLLEGSVKVTKGNKSVVIKPGEQAQIGSLQTSITIKKDADLDVVMAWKNGLFKFDGDDLKTIMMQAARWYDVDVIYEGESEETFSGSTQRSERISHLLKILEATGKVTFQINGKQLIVKSK